MRQMFFLILIAGIAVQSHLVREGGGRGAARDPSARCPGAAVSARGAWRPRSALCDLGQVQKFRVWCGAEGFEVLGFRVGGV